ncbi:MAG: M48 family metallopeptidase [Pseudomonadales bacterium]|nr:M48 family metallopeptidase [Pseudomonadales bacterium]
MKYQRTLAIAGRDVEIFILRQRRKTMAIHVFRDKPVEMRVPLNCAWHDIESFLASRHAWIDESLDALAGLPLPVLPRYVDGEMHDYLGQPLALALVHGRTRHVSVGEDRLVVRSASPDNPDKVRQAIEQFYRDEARRLLPQRVDACRERFGFSLPPTRITYRRMKARWGSCSRSGELCFNILLMQKPLAAIDFVATHELCHLRHFSHDRAFYDLMGSVMPDWRDREQLLADGVRGPVVAGTE